MKMSIIIFPGNRKRNTFACITKLIVCCSCGLVCLISRLISDRPKCLQRSICVAYLRWPWVYNHPKCGSQSSYRNPIFTHLNTCIQISFGSMHVYVRSRVQLSRYSCWTKQHVLNKATCLQSSRWRSQLFWVYTTGLEEWKEAVL